MVLPTGRQRAVAGSRPLAGRQLVVACGRPSAGDGGPSQEAGRQQAVAAEAVVSAAMAGRQQEFARK